MNVTHYVGIIVGVDDPKVDPVQVLTVDEKQFQTEFLDEVNQLLADLDGYEPVTSYSDIDDDLITGLLDDGFIVMTFTKDLNG